MSGLPRVYMSAGDPSGDMHGAAVVRELRANGVEIEAMGGPHIAGAGALMRWRLENVATIGFIEAVSRIPHHVAMLRTLRRDLTRGRYDLVIAVDYPGFNLRLAQAAAAAGVPVLYYIAPQMWAWGAWRVPRFRSAVRVLAAVLPFEREFFADRGVPTAWVGHPLLDRERPSKPDARRALATNGRPTIALLPGSRPEEVARLWPVFRDAAAVLRSAHPSLAVVLAEFPGCEYPNRDTVVTHRASAETAVAAADVALCKSGTSTLEAALADTPLVVAYRMSAPTYQVAKRVIRLPVVGLVNLLSNNKIADEFIQGAANPANLARAVERLMETDGPEAAKQREGLAAVRSRLGTPGVASRVAGLALRLVA